MADEEKVLAVDENDVPLPQTIARTQAIRDRVWRRAAGGLIVDQARGLVLCHRRSNAKDERPGVWVATFGGKVRVEETTVDAAKRELREEFGIDVDMTFVTRHKSEERKQFEYVFISSIDAERYALTPDHNEVAECAWLAIEAAIDNLQTRRDWFAYGYEVPLLSALT